MMRSILRGVALGVLLSIGAFSASAQSNPAAFDLSGGDYSFTEWPSSSPAGTYPTSMVFHTFGNRIEFGNLEEEPNGDWPFDYARGSAARVTGEGVNGVAFCQTGSSQGDALQPTFLGAAVLSLNTTGRGNVMVSWTAQVTQTGTRPYALRLQYRLGESGPWQNAMDGLNPVQLSAATDGTGALDFAHTLPASLENQGTVQLRWLYFQDGTGSGARPFIRLDDVSVTSEVYTGGPVLPAYATTDGSLLSGYAGTPLRPITVRIFTGSNDLDLGYAQTLTVSKVGGTAGSLSGTLSVNASQGVAVFDNIIVSSPGTITLKVTVPDVDDQVFSTVLILPTPTLTTNIVPQYIYGKFASFSGFHTPSYAHVTFTNLTPNSKYRFVTGVNAAQEMYPTSAGPGFNINYDQTQNSYDYTGGKSVNSMGDHSIFATGENETTKSVWVNLVPTISNEFWPQTELYWQVELADGNSNRIKVYQLGQTSMTMTNTTDDAGATLIGDRNSQLGEKNFVVLYDNEAGSGRPLATSIVQSYNTTVSFATNRYRFDIENRPGAWMTQIPNTLMNGVRRIEERSWKTGELVYAVTSADGDWNGVSTYPNGYEEGPGSFFRPIYLSTPTITVSFPAAGDTLCAGRLYTIAYRADGMDNVMLEYSVDGGQNYSSIINSTPATGSYEWAVPGAGFAGNCMIRVTGVDRPNERGLSGSFAIVEPLALIEPISSKNLCLGATDTLIALVAGSVESYTWYKDGQVIPFGNGPVLLLSDVQYNSAGVYWCEVGGYGECGDVTTNMSHVRVARQTRLVNQTYAVPGVIGETVTMFVQAEFPDEVISYQWYKGQTALTDDGHYYGTASSRLEIRDFADGDYGNDYYCQIVGVCGTVASRVVRVFPTGVYVEFVNPEFSVCGSGDVEVEALVYSNPAGENLNIQWYRNGIALSNGAVYDGVTSATLTIKNATAAQAGEYVVRASLAVEPSLMSEATATVVIATPPTITGQPADEDVCAGESVTLTVSVNATSAVSYQWFQDGTEVPGATDASYEIMNATDIRAGEYTVEITTACGTITSDAATLTVKPATEITTQPEGTVDIAAGETLTLTVAATGSGTVQYQWFKDGTELTGEVAATYTKMSATADDAGLYWCRIQAECGEVLSDTSEVTIRPVVSVDEDVIAGGVIIDRVSPNPINGTGNVSVTLPRSMNVTMTLVDASGSVVATVSTGLLPAGTHRFAIDAASVSSGMYALQTVVEGARHLQTVMIMK